MIQPDILDEPREEIVVYKGSLEGEEVFRGVRKACRNFIGNYAYKNNEGIFRCWYEEGSKRYYFDCGNAMFYTYKKLEEDIIQESEIVNDKN